MRVYGAAKWEAEIFINKYRVIKIIKYGAG